MSNTKDGVNPLRPYYKPPTIGEQNQTLPSRSPNPFSHVNTSNTNTTNTATITTTAAASKPSTTSNTTKYASKARDIFQDIDYNDYINDPSPSTVQSVKNLVDELLWKYTSVLMAQPFEVAKTILQVRLQDDLGGLHGIVPPTPTHRSKPSITSPKIPAIDNVTNASSPPFLPFFPSPARSCHSCFITGWIGIPNNPNNLLSFF